MCFNYSTNIRKISDIKKSRGNYLQKSCSGHSGPLWVLSSLALQGPRSTSGPQWPTSLPLARAWGRGQGPDPRRAPGARGKKRPNKSAETKAQIPLLYYEVCRDAKVINNWQNKCHLIFLCQSFFVY